MDCMLEGKKGKDEGKRREQYDESSSINLQVLWNQGIQIKEVCVTGGSIFLVNRCRELPRNATSCRSQVGDPQATARRNPRHNGARRVLQTWGRFQFTVEEDASNLF